MDFKCERFFLEMLTVLNVETKSSSIVKNNKSVVLLIFKKYDNIFLKFVFRAKLAHCVVASSNYEKILHLFELTTSWSFGSLIRTARGPPNL